MKKEKILFILPYEYGSIGTSYSYNIVQYLMQSGLYDVTIASKSKQESFNVSGGNIKNICLSGSKLNMGRQVIDLIKKLNPNIVHMIYRRHLYLIPIIYGLNCLFTSKKIPKWVIDQRSPVLAVGFKVFFSKIYFLIEQFFFDLLLSHCDFSLKTLCWRIYIPHEITPPGVNKVNVPNRNISFKQVRSIKCVYVGSLDKLRMLESMLTAFNIASLKVNRNIVPVNLSLDIIGEGDETYLMSLEKLISTYKNDNIKFLGKMPQNELLRALPGYHVGLSWVPSNLYDGAPVLKTLEYMSEGLVVVATDTEWHKQLIIDNVNGFLASQDVESFANSIINAVSNCLSDSSVTFHAMQTVSKFEWDKIVNEKLIPCYKKLLQNS